MTVLLHICCGPCALVPVSTIRAAGYTVTGFFYNPNIHPFKEFQRRLESLEIASQQLELPVEYDRHYGLREYLRSVVFREDSRCELCYEMRLRATAQKALAMRANAFSTTLLYSRYQNHALIKEHGDALAVELGIPFYYEDFRTGWQEGIDLSLAMGLYRQPYCGCIYSEQERYDKQWQKEKRRLAVTHDTSPHRVKVGGR